jgi:probable rRNA maturation factor
MTDISVGGRVLGLPAPMVRSVVRAVLEGERRQVVISVTFLGPVAMRRLNKRHKNHDRPTDVLSFALPMPDGRLAGDIYVCRAVARKQAGDAGVGVKEELVRLVVHGVLHVLGYDHPERNGREHSAMWRKQEKYVRKVLRA